MSSLLLCAMAWSSLLPLPCTIACGDSWVAPPLADVEIEAHVYRFEARRGMHVVFETFADPAWPRPVNTQVTLFLANSSEPIAYNNDKNFGDLYSRLSACIPADGSYEAHVDVWPGNIGGAYAAAFHCAEPQLHHDGCEAAGSFTCGPLLYENPTRCLTNDFDPGRHGCSGYAATGGDAVLGLAVEAGAELEVTLRSSADAVLYLVADCQDVRGSCVKGADRGLVGEPETLRYRFDQSGKWYLVLDHHGGGQGWLQLSGSINCTTVSVRQHTWTQVRQRYRE